MKQSLQRYNFKIKKRVCWKKDEIVNKNDNTYHSTIKMKPADVNSSKQIDFNKGNNKEVPEFEFRDHVRISKYKNLFAFLHLRFKLIRSSVCD